MAESCMFQVRMSVFAKETLLKALGKIKIYRFLKEYPWWKQKQVCHENPTKSISESGTEKIGFSIITNRISTFSKTVSKKLFYLFCDVGNYRLFLNRTKWASKVFCPLFFKKVGGVKGRQPLSRILKGGSPLTPQSDRNFSEKILWLSKSESRK